MNDIQVFTFNNQWSVRGQMHDGEPVIVAADVCNALAIGNTSDALRRLDDDEKGVVSIDTPGGIQQMAYVTEAGLYSLVLGSKKPEAKPFKRWVTHDVLPAIRKTGSYSMKPVTALEALAQTVSVLQQQEAQIKQLQGSVQTIKDAIITKPENWRRGINALFNQAARAAGGGEWYENLRNQSYNLLEERARCDLSIRLNNKQQRMSLAGATKTALEDLGFLDVIEEDARLREIYAGIIRELKIKYCA